MNCSQCNKAVKLSETGPNPGWCFRCRTSLARKKNKLKRRPYKSLSIDSVFCQICGTEKKKEELEKVSITLENNKINLKVCSHCNKV